MNTDLTNRNYFRQSHLIINSKYALTSSEINLILTLLTAIKKEDEDFKDYQFTLANFNEKTSKKITSTDLKSAIKGLMGKPLEIEESPTNWEIFHWFSYFRYKDGLITCRFDKRLKPYLLEIKDRFVVSDLRMLLPIRSSYSKRMYLLLKEYSKIGKRTFNVEELQEVLKVPKSFKVYSEFKKKVLKRAELDINKFTDLEIKLNDKNGKRGRKVVEVTFEIKKNNADLKTFISYIRELYVNELLYHTENGRPLKCSDTGLLYYSDTMENINKVESMKLWEYLHENQASLTCFQGNLFDEEEVINTLAKKPPKRPFQRDE
ncbi:MAG: replication initiation protein [Campylobacterales bacterium]|nr:replication initiation protein [Campylobacterota bacterium]MBD3842851.1 replication initiation protein [Campylobacterales bacterium]